MGLGVGFGNGIVSGFGILVWVFGLACFFVGAGIGVAIGFGGGIGMWVWVWVLVLGSVFENVLWC